MPYLWKISIFGQGHAAVELAESGDDLLALNQPFGRGAPLGRHPPRVDIDDLDLLAEQPALRIDLIQRDRGGVLHVGALSIAAGRGRGGRPNRSRSDPRARATWPNSGSDAAAPAPARVARRPTLRVAVAIPVFVSSTDMDFILA